MILRMSIKVIEEILYQTNSFSKQYIFMCLKMCLQGKIL